MGLNTSLSFVLLHEFFTYLVIHIEGLKFW